MGNLFGKKKISRVTNHDKAVLKKPEKKIIQTYQKRELNKAYWRIPPNERIACEADAIHDDPHIFSAVGQQSVAHHETRLLHKQQMKQQRDRLKQYQIRIEKTLETERQLAKSLLSSGKRDRAKLLLKKKRYQEQMLQRADGQLENMEKLIYDLEFAMIETQVFDGLKVGNEALKKVNEMISIEEVERILDETNEGIEKQKEIDALLSGELTAEDENAVEEEFNALIAADEAQVIDNKLPQVPSDQLPERTLSVEEEEFEEIAKVPIVERKPKKIAVAAD